MTAPNGTPRPRKRGRRNATTVDDATPSTEPAADAHAPDAPVDGGEAAADAAGSGAEAVDEPQLVDLIPDDVRLARSQLAAGLAPLAEGTLRRRIARLEADGLDADDEVDAARTLLAEALLRQGRPLAARASLEQVRGGSQQRRLPIALIVEAEALAAAGEPDRAAGAMERVLAAVGVDAAWRLRAGAPSRLAWPLPADLEPERRPPPRPPWATGPGTTVAPAPRTTERRPVFDAVPVERTAASRARLEAARAAYASGKHATGDTELSLGLRLDPSLAIDALRLIEPTLGDQPGHGRLLLYGDLLRAAGRQAEAAEAYDRAAEART